MIPFTLALIALGVIYVVGCFLVELECFGWATLVLVATVAGVQFLHVADILAFVSQNIVMSLLYTLAYLVAGVAWSFVKWFSFLMKFRDKFREVKQKFLVLKQIPHSKAAPVPPELQGEFDNHLRSQWSYGEYACLRTGQKPTAVENKARIISWMAFWPCSMIGTLFNDPVRRICRLLFDTFKTLYQKLADAVFANDLELK